MKKTILKTFFIAGLFLSLVSNIQAFDTYGMTSEEIQKMRADMEKAQRKAEQDKRINKKIEHKVEEFRKTQYEKELAKERQHHGHHGHHGKK
jgi:sortase (surface protein transpeptidase)